MWNVLTPVSIRSRHADVPEVISQSYFNQFQSWYQADSYNKRKTFVPSEVAGTSGRCRNWCTIQNMDDLLNGTDRFFRQKNSSTERCALSRYRIHLSGNKCVPTRQIHWPRSSRTCRENFWLTRWHKRFHYLFVVKETNQQSLHFRFWYQNFQREGLVCRFPLRPLLLSYSHTEIKNFQTLFGHLPFSLILCNIPKQLARFFSVVFIPNFPSKSIIRPIYWYSVQKSF
jgi:hypothetical protein